MSTNEWEDYLTQVKTRQAALERDAARFRVLEKQLHSVTKQKQRHNVVTISLPANSFYKTGLLLSQVADKLIAEQPVAVEHNVFNLK